MSVLFASFLFLVAAACGGALLARAHLACPARPVPSTLALVHPLLAASGLLLLGASSVRARGAGLVVPAFLVLGVAAGLGMTLALLRVRRGRGAPHLLVGLHATLALVGITLVGVELWGGSQAVPPPFPTRELEAGAR